MAVTGIASNHFKYQRQRGEIRLKAQLHNVSLTFADATNKITLPSSAVTAGFEVGDRIKTNSANAGNVGPFTITAIGGVGNVELTVALMSTGGAVAFTDGTENNLTIGTYLVEVLLMRDGFVFDKDVHATLSNIKADTTATTLNAVASTLKFTRASGSFVTDGFVPGNLITASGFGGTVDGTYTIDTVAALEIVVIQDGTGVMADITGGGDERLIANDELATGNGYTQEAKLTGVITLDENDTNDRSDGTFPTVTWTASGGSIGPTPSALLVETVCSDSTIIGCIDFGANETATDATTFDIAAGTIRGA